MSGHAIAHLIGPDQPTNAQVGRPVKIGWTSKHDETRYLLQRLGLQTAPLPAQINPQDNLDPSEFIKSHQNALMPTGFEALSRGFMKGLNPVKSFRFAMAMNDYVSLAGHEAPSAASVVLDDLVAIVEIDTKVNWFNCLQVESHILDTTWTCYADSHLVSAVGMCVMKNWAEHVPKFPSFLKALAGTMIFLRLFHLQDSWSFMPPTPAKNTHTHTTIRSRVAGQLVGERPWKAGSIHPTYPMWSRCIKESRWYRPSPSQLAVSICPSCMLGCPVWYKASLNEGQPQD